MKKLLFACLSLVLALCVIPATGQTIVDLRLNEILVKNNNNLNDEYGNHPAWVEVFNTSFNSVNIGGCFLTDDTTGLAAAQKDKEALNTFKASCYHIPTGDPTTLIQQRSCLVFYLDGKADLGTFHVSFTPDHSNYIALIGSDGKTLLDIMFFPESIREKEVSFGCQKDGVVADNRDNSVLAKKNNQDLRTTLKHYTPGSNNHVLAGESKADKLIQNDPYGIMMALMSMFIVFTVLVVIFFVLKIFAHFATKQNNKNAQPKAAPAPKAAAATGKPSDEELAAITLALDKAGVGANDEEIAAISLALFLYLDTQHDQESEVITFNITPSHWGGKQFNFKQDPR